MLEEEERRSQDRFLISGSSNLSDLALLFSSPTSFLLPSLALYQVLLRPASTPFTHLPLPALFNQLLSSRSCRPAEGRLRPRAPKHRPPPWPVRAPTRRRTSRRRPVLRAKVRPAPSSSSLGVFRLLLSMRLGETGQLKREKKCGEEKNSRRARADLPPSAFVFSPLPTAYTPSPSRKSPSSTLIFSLVFSFGSELARY